MARIALAQINPTVGDLEGNLQLIKRAIDLATRRSADLVAFPELAVTGYPPEDLLLKRGFVADNLKCLDRIAASAKALTAVVGFVDQEGDHLYNAAALISEGEIVDVYRKHQLPNYGVFDERRYFTPGTGILLGELGTMTFGVTICEDLWSDDGPHKACAEAGADLIVNINASPYHMGKGRARQELVMERARQNKVAFAYVNAVGGQDELVFDGQSMGVDSNGKLVARAHQFKEQMLVLDLSDKAGPDQVSAPKISAELKPEAEAYAALTLGVRDYLGKNHFSQGLVGISGGIDSALTAAIAVDALGPNNVLGVFNPGEFTSTESCEDAAALSKNLGFELITLPINEAFSAICRSLDPVFSGSSAGVAEENLQARIRGMMWMAISNKTGKIVLSTGNKSELAVGYATLYGDMAGGFAVLKDVPKTLVYRLARWRNHSKEVIPGRIIERPPTAELRAGQLDTDSLPPYEVLDPILEAYVEEDLSVSDIAARGLAPLETVAKIVEMVDKAEYKRRQAAPGIKITDRAFGRDRRLPITNGYRSH